MHQLIKNAEEQFTNPDAPQEVRWAVLLMWALLIASTAADTLDLLFANGTATSFGSGLLSTLFAAALPIGVNRQSNGMRYMYGLSAMFTLAWLIGGPSTSFSPTGPISRVFDYASAPATFLTLYWLFKGVNGIWFAPERKRRHEHD